MNPSEKTYYQFNEPQKIIFQSLVDLKCISGLVASDYYKKIEFFSGNFCSLSIFLDYCASKRGSEKLSYDEAVNMAFCLGQQIYHFEKNLFQKLNILFRDLYKKNNFSKNYLPCYRLV